MSNFNKISRLYLFIIVGAFVFCLFPKTALADISQLDMSATSTIYGFGIRYQTLGAGLSGTITGIDIAKMVNATYYNEFVTPILEECSSSDYSDCVAVTSSPEQQGTSTTISSGIASYQTNQYTLNHCKYYRLALNFHSVGWGVGQLWFLGTTTDSYPEGLYANGADILTDIYFVLHGVDRLDYSANTPENICVDPVIIVPGFLGSFEKNGMLLMDPILHAYDDLIATLEANGYVASSTLFTFPYNWRNSNVDTALLLKQKIDEIKTICNCSKVDIVAHSMGGLVTRQYVQSDAYGNDIDQVIFLATPHLGSPKAYLAWEGGAFPVPSISDAVVYAILRSEAKHSGFADVFDYIQNRPITSIKELLPVYDYLFKVNSDTGISTQLHYPTGYPNNSFLDLLNNTIDRLSRVRYTNVIGDTGVATVGSLRTSTSSSPTRWSHGQPQNFILGSAIGLVEGDKTVPYSSSSLLSVGGTVMAEHTNVPDVAIEKVYNILTGNSVQTLIREENNPDYVFLVIVVFSPIDISITAPDGKKIGYTHNSGEINEISGAFYSGNNTDNEFIVIPNPLDGEYKVEAIGTNDGEYTVAVSSASDGTIVDAEYTSVTKTGDVSKLILNVDTSSPSPNLAIAPEPLVTVAEIPNVITPLSVSRSGRGSSHRSIQQDIVPDTQVATSTNLNGVNSDKLMIALDIPIERFISFMTNPSVKPVNKPIETAVRQSKSAKRTSQTQTASVISIIQGDSSESGFIGKIKEGFKKLFNKFKK